MPTKAIYEAFDADPSLEFDFFLAEKLKIGTVAEMRSRMSQLEYMQWNIRFARMAQRAEVARG